MVKIFCEEYIQRFSFISGSALQNFFVFTKSMELIYTTYLNQREIIIELLFFNRVL